MVAWEWDTPRLNEDVHLKPLGPVRGYASECSGPVRYRTVARFGGDEVLGYLWYDDAENAAGYVANPALGDDAVNAGTLWYRRLSAAGERGLTPSQAVAEFEKPNVGGKGSGRVVPGSDTEAPSLAELQVVNSGGEALPAPSGDWEEPPAGGAGPGCGRRVASYSTHVSGPVLYLPVELEGRVIGYLYAAVRGNSASYIRRLKAQDTDFGFGGAVVWSQRLRDAYQAGLPAEEALRRWAGAEEHPVAGAIPAGAEFTELGDYEALRQLANPGHTEPPVPAAPPEPEYFPDGTPLDRSKGWGPLSPFRLDSPGYTMATDSSVRYLPAYRGDLLLGYLWAAETDDAAGFVSRVEARADGHRAKSRWISRMEQCESDGLRPLEMLRSWVGAAEDPKAGRIPADAEEQSAPRLQDLNIRARLTGDGAPPAARR